MERGAESRRRGSGGKLLRDGRALFAGDADDIEDQRSAGGGGAAKSGVRAADGERVGGRGEGAGGRVEGGRAGDGASEQGRRSAAVVCAATVVVHPPA